MLATVIIIIVVAVLCAFMASIVYWSWRNGISPMPTTHKARRAIFSMLPMDIKGTVYELGCGWGTLLVPLARKYPHLKVIGYETSHIPFWVSKLRVKAAGLNNAEVRRKDFFGVNLSDAALVVCYLYPGAMRRLADKFAAELPSGTWIISNTFALPRVDPVSVIKVEDMYRSSIYTYKWLKKLNNKITSTSEEKPI